MYSLGREHPIVDLSVGNNFVNRLNKACSKLGDCLQPFCFFASDIQKEFNVLDLTEVSGIEDESVTLLQEVASKRNSFLLENQIYLGDLTDKLVKRLFIDYLITVSACFIEIPTYRSKNGGSPEPTYEKFIATKNPRLIANWLGVSEAEVIVKHGYKLETTAVQLLSDTFQGFAKLMYSKRGGASVIFPRKGYSVDEISCTPLFAINSFMQGLRGHMEEGILEFLYLKDNRTTRQLCTTLNRGIAMSLYKDSDFVEKAMDGVSVYAEEEDGLGIVPTQLRGYVRLFELGISKYDYSAVRALNINRLLKVSKKDISDIDTTFIDVDTDSVVNSFDSYLDTIYVNSNSDVFEVYRCLLDKEFDGGSASQCLEEIKNWVTMQETILTTTFRRSLHKFMINNPVWFSGYVGKPFSSGVDSTNFGVETLDF